MIHYQARFGSDSQSLDLSLHHQERQVKKREKERKKKALDGSKSALNYFPYAEALHWLITAGSGVFMLR